jgi:hypothetical protein
LIHHQELPKQAHRYLGRAPGLNEPKNADDKHAASAARGSRLIAKSLDLQGFRGNRPGPLAAVAASVQTLNGPATRCDLAAVGLVASTKVDTATPGRC